MKLCGIAIVKEVGVTFMGMQYFDCMLDGAKILLGSRNNFTRIGNEATGIGTIQAMKFFNCIKIRQVLMIKKDKMDRLALGIL